MKIKIDNVNYHVELKDNGTLDTVFYIWNNKRQEFITFLEVERNQQGNPIKQAYIEAVEAFIENESY